MFGSRLLQLLATEEIRALKMPVKDRAREVLLHVALTHSETRGPEIEKHSVPLENYIR